MASRLEVDLIVEAISKGFDRVQSDLRETGQASRRTGDDIEKGGKSAAKGAEGTDKMQKSTSSLSSAMKGLVTAGTILVAGKQMLEFGKESIAAASAAQETSSLLDNSLGPAARQFSKDIAEVADATNRSRFQLEEGASTFVAMSRNMGLGQQAAADFSTQMTQTAVDLGSFFNRAESDVLVDLQGALAGSSETMQKYGVDVRETTLKQIAYEQGLIETGETLDRATRAQLILSETMRQASDAMGDAERTADSYENTARSLSAELHDLKVGLGEELIPATREGTGVLAAMVRAMNDSLETQETLRRAEELGIISRRGLLQFGLVLTDAEVERTRALVESKEAAYDRAAAEDALRKAMEGGTAAIVANNREWEEANRLIAAGGDELRDAAMEAAKIEEGRRTLTWEVETDVDVDTGQAEKEVEDFIERLEGRALEISLAIREQEDPREQMGIVSGARPTAITSQELARQSAINAEQFSESFRSVLEEKLTGKPPDIPELTPTVDYTQIDTLEEKLTLVQGIGGEITDTQIIPGVDDTDIDDLKRMGEDTQGVLSGLQENSPYSTEVSHNFDDVDGKLQGILTKYDRLQDKTVTIRVIEQMQDRGMVPKENLR